MPIYIFGYTISLDVDINGTAFGDRALVHLRALVSVWGRLNFPSADEEYVISPKEGGGRASQSGKGQRAHTPNTVLCGLWLFLCGN